MWPSPGEPAHLPVRLGHVYADDRPKWRWGFHGSRIRHDHHGGERRAHHHFGENGVWRVHDRRQHLAADQRNQSGAFLNTDSGGVVWSNAPSFAQGLMPTQLGPISVTVGGQPGYIFFYCSAATDPACTAGDQINVLSPLNTSSSMYPVEVVVTNNGVSSAPFTVLNNGYSPTFPFFDATRARCGPASRFQLSGSHEPRFHDSRESWRDDHSCPLRFGSADRNRRPQ